MDKNRVVGTMDEVVGHAKRKVGEWSGDIGTEVDGAAQEFKGKVEQAFGQAKDAARAVRANIITARDEKLAADERAGEAVRANTPVIREIP